MKITNLEKLKAKIEARKEYLASSPIMCSENIYGMNILNTIYANGEIASLNWVLSELEKIEATK